MTLFKSVLTIVMAGMVFLSAATLTPAYAGDPVIDAAKEQGQVGERIDGFLGVVSNAEPSVVRRVDEINARRRAVYADLAAREGVNLSDVARLTGERLVAAEPSGHFVLDDSGQWIAIP